jgi:hypothetical protein
MKFKRKAGGFGFAAGGPAGWGDDASPGRSVA